MFIELRDLVETKGPVIRKGDWPSSFQSSEEHHISLCPARSRRLKPAALCLQELIRRS